MFASNAEGYHEYRPPLSAEVVRWLGLVPGWKAVDVGAGTGQAAQMLNALGAEVIAIEPDQAMCGVMKSRHDGLDVRLGSAEALPVGDGSVDLVLSVSAWHWFDQGRAFSEAERVLRPGGILAIVGNGVDRSDPWGRRFMAAAETSDTPVVGHEDRPGWHALHIPEDSPLHESGTTTIRWTWTRSAEQVMGLIGTFSTYITGSSELRAQITESASKLLGEVMSDDGQVGLPMAARCWKLAKPLNPSTPP